MTTLSIPATLALPMAAALLLAVQPATPARAATASVWTLSLDGGAKECRLTLRPDTDGKGAPVAMPPGCHRAFPSLTHVALWSLVGDRLQLDDARGDLLLAFDPDGAGFRTTSPQGDALVLTSITGKGRASLEGLATTAPAQVQVSQATASTKKAAAGETPADVAGRYAVLRDKTRDTGCMVTLDDKTGGPGHTMKARLAPACRDQGIVIFDPVGWQMVGGKMVLTARKGHTTELGPQGDGSWTNDPKKGKALSLKRI